ncbi:hypothetical protein POTOM_027663 [Populus tomentosa]|uniref:Uncharacterized protein n=1 Tax=Populus tomentosa TaxID=118781 RepID=A0A8X7ZF85_POPTO|nr:hypothetical protein POTOM_027663 [Populus tomentosa]
MNTLFPSAFRIHRIAGPNTRGHFNITVCKTSKGQTDSHRSGQGRKEDSQPASPPNTDDLESQSSQPLPSSSNTTSESQSPTGGRPPLTINESQRNNVLDAKPDLETGLRTTLLSFCFAAALEITIQSKQVAESEIHKSINLISLAIAAIFASLFVSPFIGKKIPTASKVLEKVAFFLAATTFFFAIATPFPLGIKCAIWAVYIMSLIAIAFCTCL